MQKNVRFIGLDVHAESIVIAVANSGDAPAEFLKRGPDQVAAKSAVKSAFEIPYFMHASWHV